MHLTRHTSDYVKNTSSTKPEVHKLSQRCQWRTEPRPLATYTKIFTVLRPCDFWDMQVDKQTDMLITAHLRASSVSEIIKYQWLPCMQSDR